MEMVRLWWWVWILFHIHVNGCLESERMGLLQIKASINYPNGTSLPSWESNDKHSNCCDWKSVECNNGRVIQLLLNATYNWDHRYDITGWYMNFSLFLPFKELVYLDLSRIRLAGWVKHEGFERLSELRKLEVLILDLNLFDNSILPSLGAISSLKTLSLAFNKLNGSIDTQAFLNMSNLVELDLSGNRINSFTGNEGFGRLSELKKLEVLILDTNLFNNSILPSLGAISSLKTLSLASNKLNGSIDTQAFLNMSNLVELDLSGNWMNSFTGNEGLKSLSKLKIMRLGSNSFKNASILQSLGALSSLRELDLRDSYELLVLVTEKDLEGLANLEELYLDRCSIDVSFFHNAGVLTSLRVLSMPDIEFNGRLPNQGWCELYNLEELDLSGNELNGILPWCMRNLTSLRFLELSYNHFTGSIAASPLTSLTSLQYLSISHNDFVIPISFFAFYNHSKLKLISGDHNRLSDHPISIIPRFQLKVFSLSNCNANQLLSEGLFHFLYHQHDLIVVDLSHNNLTDSGGTLFFLSWLLANNTQLVYLNLRNNSFSGPFPLLTSSPYNITKWIDISNNHIHGQLPTNISSIFPSLNFLNLSQNELEGRIPASLGDLHSLSYLDLSNNHLSGQIPQHFAIGCFSIYFLKLSNNTLDGRMLPDLVTLTSLEYLYLDNNRFEGKIPDSLSTASGLTALDISNNSMSGHLPIWIGNMRYIEVLIMSKNHFEGPIPAEFCKLDWLSVLDLSNNNLSGSIPSCFNSSEIEHVHLNHNMLSGPFPHAFYNCSSLVTLDLRQNNLSGKIPSWIGNLSSLSILLLKSNSFEGKLPHQLCSLKGLTILDLSQNNLSGSIPHCFGSIPFKPMTRKSYKPRLALVVDWRTNFLSYVVMETMLSKNYDVFQSGQYFPLMVATQVVEFTTKSRLYAYCGNILDYMSGVDLSCNLLTGEIPSAIGNLSEIHALNLSHNNLIGSIPTTFSMLKQVESLDLSYNKLSGTIPSQLIELNYLAVFSVSHNNLSGTTPEWKAQFGTFEESSYEGNPLLCGPPLRNSCNKTGSPLTLPHHSLEEEGFMDMEVFYVTFMVSFIIAFLGVVAVLCINPYWRRAWFRIVEAYGTSCYYFVLDCFLKAFIRRGV
ncbi:cuscuta receptor 1-like isoform X2 [Cornus florida]|uniref:cuscuta receptor 1-like isoform X2 n=1 Tax=Cornus florida TaxID=4283 RepID=UPI00289D978E|nr:cuscuta receptor 1-like isoform X2 [Cornus florida]